DAFPRKRRYTLGTELRHDALNLVLLAQQVFRATRDRQRQLVHIEALSDTIDQLRLRLQLAMRLQCLSWARFEALIRLVRDLGRQCGAWRRSILHGKGQNPPASAPA